MRKVIKVNKGVKDCAIGVEAMGSDFCINLWQDEDFIMLMNERQARKVVKAIRKAAEELGWEV